MKRYARITDLQPLVGQHLAVSDWIAVDQRRIDLARLAVSSEQESVDEAGNGGWVIGMHRPERRTAS